MSCMLSVNVVSVAVLDDRATFHVGTLFALSI